MREIIFRKAHAHEGELLTELSLRSKSFWKYSQEFLEKCRPLLTIDQSYIENWPVIVLVNPNNAQGEILGYYSLKVVGSENRLDNLWLDLPFIRKGFGSVAIEHAKKEARLLGWDHFYLASEPLAVAFYEKYGGKMIGLIQSKLDENLQLPHIKFTI
jgi:GNAT superfamily N-acetyltransferase